MSSGRIGAWEVQKITGSKVAAELCEPFRDQSLEMYFMGYLVEGLIEIWRGYGELPEKEPMRYKIWTKFGIRYTENKILADFMNERLTFWQRLQLWFGR